MLCRSNRFCYKYAGSIVALSCGRDAQGGKGGAQHETPVQPGRIAATPRLCLFMALDPWQRPLSAIQLVCSIAHARRIMEQRFASVKQFVEGKSAMARELLGHL
jgi:hypothetical protein